MQPVCPLGEVCNGVSLEFGIRLRVKGLGCIAWDKSWGVGSSGLARRSDHRQHGKLGSGLRVYSVSFGAQGGL